MKKNLLALVLIMLACALATQWPRLANQKLRNELGESLERLWAKPGQTVELLSAPGGVDARVLAVLPADCTARQDQWNFQVLRFVSQRYGDPKLLRISLSDRDSKRNIEEQASSSVSESKDQNRVESKARSAPGPLENANEAHLELIRRQAQAWLDQKLGPGNGLALVDGTAKVDNQPLYEDATDRHYLRARPEESERKEAPSVEANSVVPAVTTTTFTTRLVLVVNGRAPGADKFDSSELSTQLGMVSGRDEVRVVILP